MEKMEKERDTPNLFRIWGFGACRAYLVRKAENQMEDEIEAGIL